MALTQDRWLFDNDGSPKDQNPNYLCTITSSDPRIGVIIANMPEEFTTDVSANYEEAFAQAVNSTQASASAAGLLRAAGVQLTTQALTAQVWQGSSDMSFSIPLVFQAIDDEYEDVVKKLEALYSLTLPDELFSNGLLTAPGPRLSAKLLTRNLGDAAKQSLEDLINIGSNVLMDSGKDSKSTPTRNANTKAGAASPLISSVENNISLRLGRFMFFESVVITSLNQTTSVLPLKSGVMSQVVVHVGFKTFFTPTKADIPYMFLRSTRPQS